MFFKSTLLATVFAATLGMGGNLAYAQAAPEQPTTFSADNVTHDKDLGTITARGHVEVNQAGRLLRANTITYDQTHDLIRATGNVSLLRLNGDVFFANSMEVTGDLKNGVIEDFHAILADESRFAARKATLTNDETLTLDYGVYSPCQRCRDFPRHTPLWQIKAVKVVHDRVHKIVKYTDAWLEFMGVPVMYMPYMSYPDPSVKRKSGFLTPRVGGSSDLGFGMRTPYFYVIDDHSDITLTPILSSKENGAVAAQYRKRFTKGELNSNLSLAYDSKQNVLGHIDTKARFDINRSWRWGVDVQRSSTDTYMRRYGFGSQDTLTSRAFLEGFRGNSYTSFSTMAFQGLRSTDKAKTTPLILPLIKFNYQGDPDRLGAYNTFDVNVAMLTRDQGISSKRISLKPTWNLPYVAPKGDIYKLSTSLGIDFFHAQNVPTTVSSSSVHNGLYNGAALRITPQVALDWRWPFTRRISTMTEVLEPIGQVIVSPYGGNNYKMANEDSQAFDFNDANLFTTNRFTGFDRVESGPRANYGIRWSVVGDGGGSSSVLIGQSYRLKADDTFRVGSGLEKNFSDYVGKVQVSPNTHLNLLYRTRIDKDTLNFRRNEVGLSGNAGWFSYNSDYVFFNHQQGSELAGRKEINYTLGAKVNKDWSTNFSGVRDLTQTGGQRSMRLGLVYNCDCFTFDAAISRTFYQDREVQPTDAILFRLVFKTLGAVTSNVNAN